ncbi:hypothetical protein [Alkalinema sp. FACHB-956]|uniref:hypothetical protein n=1 Tax=Alkalinema sp. FACHB-956 TaxID=2692768 RepID=UPI001688A415|nr:hypothetical protein [Alkalinema sp. FACHB-956]MBD2325501.1 hypothetical protein [Alkalinema sp. FACHB-956]
MAGLFGFGKNNDQEPQSKESFFLDDDAARSMGNTDYMRQSKKIRRTFPKSAGGEEFEIVKEVSAADQTVFNSQNGSFSASSTAASKATENGAAGSQEAQERRKLDTSMDMFRNMAKDIRR